MLAAKILALIVHEFVEEYRKLDQPDAAPEPKPAEPPRVYDIASTTAAHVERGDGWDHDQRPPVTAARFGFGRS